MSNNAFEAGQASQAKRSSLLDRPFARTLTGSLMTIAMAGLVVGVIALVVGIPKLVLITALVDLVAVLGIGTFSGNSGVLSFGHVAWVGLGAYVSGLLTVPPAIKATALPDIPHWLQTTDMSIVTALLVTMAVAMLVAAIPGIVVMRLPRDSATLATFGLLIVAFVIMGAATAYTRGGQVFFGVPISTTVLLGCAVAIVAVFVSRLFRETVFGLGLRATRDDETAASSLGVAAGRLRFIGWVISAAIAAAGGVLLAHILGAFTPEAFYLDNTFVLLAMLIVGGVGSVSGAVFGTVIIVIVQQVALAAQQGFSLGPIHVPAIIGLPQLAVAVAILLCLYLRPRGLFGNREIDEMLVDLISRRRGSGGEEESGFEVPAGSAGFNQDSAG